MLSFQFHNKLKIGTGLCNKRNIAKDRERMIKVNLFTNFFPQIAASAVGFSAEDQPAKILH
jgi:hypothetical protein